MVGVEGMLRSPPPLGPTSAPDLGGGGIGDIAGEADIDVGG